jgi:diguanylate cyclase (GGDEF)-like protein
VCLSADNSPTYILSLFEDVTDRIEAEARIAYLAHHDALTSLPNRETCELYLEAALGSAQANGQSLAIIYVGLDHFRETNDLFGTLVGDTVLCEVAHRLAGVVGGAFIARIGGDEFALVCETAEQSRARELASQIQSKLAEETQIAGNQIRIDASIGISLYPSDAESVTDLIANADAAMERAKADGRRTSAFSIRKSTENCAISARYTTISTSRSNAARFRSNISRR